MSQSFKVDKDNLNKKVFLYGPNKLRNHINLCPITDAKDDKMFSREGIVKNHSAILVPLDKIYCGKEVKRVVPLRCRGL